MKKFVLSACMLTMLSSTVMAQVSEKSEFKDKFSYSYGYTLAKTQQKILPDVDVKLALEGFRDFAQNKKARLTDDEMMTVLQQAVNAEKSKPLKEFQKLGANNQQQAQAFLKQNAKQKNVTQLKSGLQVQGLSNTKKVYDYQKVTIRYEGRLLDGTVFHSMASDESKTVDMNQLIVGLQQGIRLMTVGEKATFFIPAELAYGDIGAGIIPNSALVIFDVELISVP